MVMCQERSRIRGPNEVEDQAEAGRTDDGSQRLDPGVSTLVACWNVLDKCSDSWAPLWVSYIRILEVPRHRH